MRRKPPGLAYAAMLVVAVIAGCVPSLQPSYSEKDLVFDPVFLGAWTQTNSTAGWNFTQTGEKEYQLVYTDEEGRAGRFVGHLAEFSGRRYLDLFPVKGDVTANEFYKFHLLPIHTTYLVKQTTPSLQLAGLDMAWLNDYLKDHADAIPHSQFDGQKLITASTPQLQSFLTQFHDKFTVVFELVRAEQ
jgi:hypothetical protein